MSKVISFSNQKGGVGKTTTSREISLYLAHNGYKTLLIDSDPQANLSRSLTNEEYSGLYDALKGDDYLVNEVKENLCLLSGSIKLSLLGKSLIGEIDAYTRLRELLKGNIFDDFEYIIIDTPPSLGVLTINALTASDHLIVPMSPALYSMQGTNDLMNTISQVRKNLNDKLNLLGVIINSFDQIPVITRQIKEEIEAGFKEKVFKTYISKSIKIEELIAAQKGAVSLKKGKLKEQFISLGEEFLTRIAAHSKLSLEV